MNKKIFDIIPPDKIIKEEDSIEIGKKEKNLSRKGLGFFLKIFGLLIVFFILILFAVFFIFLKKTEIKISPQRFPLEIKGELTLDPNALGFNFENRTIPAELFKDERTLEKDFSATGKATTKNKATGTIVVYNEYSTSSRTLVPSRFVSASGKLFWSIEKITIPGYKKEGGKIVPGQTEVKVEAAEPGEDYNIEPTTFALPALAGSRLYTTIYAKSFSSMTGGMIGQVSKVSADDLEGAEKSLTQETKEAGRKALSNNLPMDYVLLEQTISQQILEAGSSVREGELVDFFKFSSKVKSSGLAVKKENIDNFVKNLIEINIKEGEKLLGKSLIVDYKIDQRGAEAGQLVLKVDIKAEIYKDIDVLELKKALLGKSFKEAGLFLQGLSEVSSFNIESKPFLRKKIPIDLERIEVRLNLD